MTVKTFGPYQATVSEIHDGDTIAVDVVLAHPTGRYPGDKDLGFGVHRTRTGIVLEAMWVRLYGCNAPELATPAGKDALAYLLTLVKVGDPVTLLSYGWDKYGGRIDGTIQLHDGRDLTAVMIAAGHAAPWDGKGVKPLPAAA